MNLISCTLVPEIRCHSLQTAEERRHAGRAGVRVSHEPRQGAAPDRARSEDPHARHRRPAGHHRTRNPPDRGRPRPRRVRRAQAGRATQRLQRQRPTCRSGCRFSATSTSDPCSPSCSRRTTPATQPPRTARLSRWTRIRVRRPQVESEEHHMYATVRRYEGIDHGALRGDHEEGRREPAAEPEPVLPGFGGYYLIDAGEGVFASVSLFETRRRRTSRRASPPGGCASRSSRPRFRTRPRSRPDR